MRKSIHSSIEKILLVAGLLLLVVLGFRTFTFDYSPAVATTWGVSFDPSYAAALGLDAKETFKAITSDLGVSNIRLTAYWDKIEIDRDLYDWSSIDWQVEMAKAKNTQVLLTVGRKLPRWPECYQPVWYNNLSTSDKEQELLEFVELTVGRYKNYSNVVAWQVENEPLVAWFGVCPAPSLAELKKEVTLVKSLDANRPIVITDSGELSSWLAAAKVADVLGVTMYRVVWNETTGYWHWPLPAAFYHYKTKIVERLTGVKKIIITELQSEPWATNQPLATMPLAAQYRSMSLDQFKNNVAYARQAGFDTVYLWGVEWWYYLKEIKGVPDFWNTARELWTK